MDADLQLVSFLASLGMGYLKCPHRYTQSMSPRSWLQSPLSRQQETVIAGSMSWVLSSNHKFFVLASENRKSTYCGNTDMWHPIRGQLPTSSHTHTYTHPYMHAHTHTYMFTHTDLHTCTHTYMAAHIPTCLHAHTHTPTCLHTHLTQYKQRAQAWEGINSGKSQVAKIAGSCAMSVWMLH